MSGKSRWCESKAEAIKKYKLKERDTFIDGVKTFFRILNDGRVLILIPFMKIDNPTNNNTVYGKEGIQSGIDFFRKMLISKRMSWGMYDHNDTVHVAETVTDSQTNEPIIKDQIKVNATTHLKTASHLVIEAWIEKEENIAYGLFEIQPVGAGIEMIERLKSGAIGVSLRGPSRYRASGKKNDNKKYIYFMKIYGIDAVGKPSDDGSWTTMLESVAFLQESELFEEVTGSEEDFQESDSYFVTEDDFLEFHDIDSWGSLDDLLEESDDTNNVTDGDTSNSNDDTNDVIDNIEEIPEEVAPVKSSKEKVKKGTKKKAAPQGSKKKSVSKTPKGKAKPEPKTTTNKITAPKDTQVDDILTLLQKTLSGEERVVQESVEKMQFPPMETDRELTIDDLSKLSKEQLTALLLKQQREQMRERISSEKYQGIFDILTRNQFNVKAAFDIVSLLEKDDQLNGTKTEEMKSALDQEKAKSQELENKLKNLNQKTKVVVTKYKDAKQAIDAESRDSQEKIEKLTEKATQSQGAFDNIFSEFKGLKERHEEMLSEGESIIESVSDLSEERDHLFDTNTQTSLMLQDALDANNSKDEAIVHLQESNDALSESLEEISETMNEKVLQMRSRVLDLTTEMENLKEENQEILLEKERLTEELEEIEEQVKETASENEKLHKSQKQLKAKTREIIEENKVITSQIEEHKKEKEELQENVTILSEKNEGLQERLKIAIERIKKSRKDGAVIEELEEKFRKEQENNSQLLSELEKFKYKRNDGGKTPMEILAEGDSIFSEFNEYVKEEVFQEGDCGKDDLEIDPVNIDVELEDLFN